jgi:RNA polymerase sigma-70 factor (ECF subfamily)
MAYPLVRRWTRVRLDDPDEAEDLTQDVLIRVLRKLDTFKEQARFTTWLYQVVRNAALDRSKQRRRKMAREEDLEVAHNAPGESRDLAQETDRARILARVRECFRELPERQREVFDMADLQGLTSPEIAERLGISASTVRVSLLKARRTIRGMILESDPELASEVT